MNIKKQALFSAFIIAISTMIIVACEKSDSSEKSRTPQVNSMDSKATIEDGIYTGEFKRESTTLYYTLVVKQGMVVDFTAKDENGVMANPPDNADWRGPKYDPISAYEIFTDMCLIEHYPCVAIVPVRTHGWNDGGKPMYYYYVVGCDYNEDGDCWYNEE